MSTAVTPSGTREDDVGKLLLRVTAGVILLLHGIGKIKGGVGWMAGPLGDIGLPAFVSYGAYVGEVIAPILVIAGKFTRLAGLVMAFNMLSAIFIARRNDIAALNQGGGWAIELEVLILVAGVCMFFLGSGRFALSRGAGRWD